MATIIDDEEFGRRRRNLIKFFAGITVVVLVVAGAALYFVNRGTGDEAPMSSPTPASTSSPSESKDEEKEVGPERDETLFQEASSSELAQIESTYNMDALQGVDKEDNPFEATPFGIFPYRINVDQVWKDTYDDNWQTMTASVLSTLDNLWNDKKFEKTVLTRDSDDVDRVKYLRTLTYRDVIYSRLGPVSGVSVGNNSPKEATSSDYAYYNAVVPVLDANGKIPGTDASPAKNSRDVSVLSVKVEEPGTGSAPADATYANYPRISVQRFVDYGNVSYTQNVSFYVQRDNTNTWKLVQVEYDDPVIQ